MLHILVKCMIWASALAVSALSALPIADSSQLRAAGVSRELAEYRKMHYLNPRYSLRFYIPEFRSESVRGQVDVEIQTDGRQPIILDFRADSAQIISVKLNEKEVPYEVKDEHLFLDAHYTCEGKNVVSVGFVPSNQSLNRRDEFLYTLLVPDRARTLFPCFDQPDMKSIYRLTLDIPSSWQAVANSAIQQIDSTNTQRRQIHFKETEPLSTYLFSFVAGKLERLSFRRGEREISIYHRETDPKKIAQCPEIAGQVFDALDWLESYTQVNYPFAKYDLIILPGFQYGGMEHTGATLYTDRRMFLDENPTLNEQLSRSALIAHETAHMWFGDFVTMKWFDDVWTKEVFANYFASQIVKPLFPEVNHSLNFMRDYLLPAYAEDRTAGSNPIKQELSNLRNAGLVYGNIIYDKSPVVMEMLIHRIGKEAFQQGIREYLRGFGYGNATWDDLIRILDKYTDDDLAAWSHVWVNEKGMPEISVEIRENSFIVSQCDPLQRGLCWPQDVSYVLSSGVHSEPIAVSFGKNSNSFQKKLKLLPNQKYTIIPNANGQGYGFFRITDSEAEGLWAVLDTSRDEILRGSLLITLYENLLHQTISSSVYMRSMQKYLLKESSPLLFSMALGYVGGCQRLYPLDTVALEQTLWQIVTTSTEPQHRLQAFRQYASIADSPKAINRLYTIWKDKSAPAECALSETDYINLSYALALHLPDKADDIVAMQQARISNPDKKKEYAFIAPSVSPQKAKCDSVFNSLLVAENRRVEPWASAALAHLNHRLRAWESVSYIRPALEAMQEVQRTGDIFFPTAWARALLSGHTSIAAREEVEAFFRVHPNYPEMLSNKIRQQADHLYRIK